MTVHDPRRAAAIALVACWLVALCVVTGACRGTELPASSQANGAVRALEHRSSKRLIISVDVEALPRRQERDHVQRLIWGRFGQAEVGIGRMMQIAESHGVRLTFFVDYCETVLYPGAFEEITAEIVRRGHDVQLHAHPEIWPAEFWASLGLERRAPVRWANFFEADQVELMFDFLMRTAAECGAPPPVAYRAGGWRINAAALQAMAARGLTLSFNYSLRNPRQPNNTENLPLFRWSNGVYEVPLGHSLLKGNLARFAFNSDLPFADAQAMRGYMKWYFDQFGADAVLVMVMHSWSFCVLDSATGYFVYQNDDLLNQFDAFLSHLAPEFTVITASELAAAIDSGELRPALVRDVELMDSTKHPAQK